MTPDTAHTDGEMPPASRNQAAPANSVTCHGTLRPDFPASSNPFMTIHLFSYLNGNIIIYKTAFVNSMRPNGYFKYSI